MIEVSQLTALIVGETLVGLLVLSGVLVLLAILRKGRIRKAAHHLAERVKADNPKRSERLKALLAEKYGYAGNELEQAIHNITQSEMRLYQNIINGFLKDDQVFLQQVDVDVENLVVSYQGLNTPPVSASAEVQVSEDSDTAEEIQHLREENERLSDELKVTMDTMGRMLNEYSTMFAGGAETFDKAGEALSAEAVAESVAEEPAPDGIDAESSAAASQQQASPVEDGAAEAEVSQPSVAEETKVEANVDIDIPDFQVDDDLMHGSDLYQPTSDDLDGVSAAVDEDVSEIIDEVMEIADEMSAQDAGESATTASAGDDGESLMDEVEQVDIEIPDMQRAELTQAESEAASLEEEWAKLLEEDAAAKDGKKA